MGPISGPAARATPSTIPDATPRASTAPTSSAATSCGWSGATGHQRRQRPGLRLPGDDRRPLESGRLPDDRLSRRDVHLRPQHDGRPRGRQRRRPEVNARSSTDHAFLYSVSQGTVPDRHRLSRLDDPPRPTASGTTAARATRSAAAIPRSASSGKTARRGLSGRLRLGDRAIHQLDVVRRPERTGRPDLRHPLPGDQQPRAGRLHARRRHRSQPARARALQASLATVRRNPDGTFGPAVLGQPELPRSPGPAHRRFRGRQPGGRDRHRRARASSRTRRRSTSGSSSPT